MTLHSDTIKDRVLSRIEEGRVHVHSKYYFYAKVALTLLVALLALLVSIFIFNFILFSLFAEHRAPLLGYGPSGYWLFLILFPWPLLAIDLVLLALLQQLLRVFEFGYKKPVIYLFFASLVVIGACGFFVYAHTGLNSRIEQEAHHRHFLRPVESFFNDAHLPPPPPPRY